MDDKPVKKLSLISIPRKYNNAEDAYNAINCERENIQEWDLISEKQAVENYTVEWCKYHFGQASKTGLSLITWKDIFDNSTMQDAI